MEKNEISILIVEPGEIPRVAIIDDSPDTFRDIVGGYLEGIKLPCNNVIFCNEMGKPMGLKGNRSLNNDIIVGTFIIAHVSELGEVVSLSKEDTDINMKAFMQPEVFTDEDIKKHSGFTVHFF